MEKSGEDSGKGSLILEIFGTVVDCSFCVILEMGIFHDPCGQFPSGRIWIGLVVLILLIAGMCVQERFFCRFFCPMGAVFSLLPVLPFFALHRTRKNCRKGCKACAKICPSQIGLPSDGDWAVSGDCFQCQKCIDICPQKHIHCGIRKLKGNEFWFTILRALILLGICLWLGL